MAKSKSTFSKLQRQRNKAQKKKEKLEKKQIAKESDDIAQEHEEDEIAEFVRQVQSGLVSTFEEFKAANADENP